MSTQNTIILGYLYNDNNYYPINTIIAVTKIASEMPVPHSLGKYFSTPWDIEVVKQYKVQDTFRAVSVILRSK